MTKSLHPSTLFHLTCKRDTLEKILTSKHYKVSIAREFIRSKNLQDKKYSIRNFGVPMVSFCDIRLSQLDEHASKYGSFGLGMSKEWAERQNLHPVMYMNQSSSLFSSYNKAIRKLKNNLIPMWKNWKNKITFTSEEKVQFETLKSQYSDIFNIIRYMKNYEGKLIRKGRIKSLKYRFADEKEWRFVPKPFHNDIWPSINFTRVKTAEGKKNYSNLYSDVTVAFNFSDIKYIIVKDESDISNISKLIKNIYNEDDISKIVTMKQIQDDM